MGRLQVSCALPLLRFKTALLPSSTTMDFANPLDSYSHPLLDRKFPKAFRYFSYLGFHVSLWYLSSVILSVSPSAYISLPPSLLACSAIISLCSGILFSGHSNDSFHLHLCSPHPVLPWDLVWFFPKGLLDVWGTNFLKRNKMHVVDMKS